MCITQCFRSTTTTRNKRSFERGSDEGSSSGSTDNRDMIRERADNGVHLPADGRPMNAKRQGDKWTEQRLVKFDRSTTKYKTNLLTKAARYSDDQLK